MKNTLQSADSWSISILALLVTGCGLTPSVHAQNSLTINSATCQSEVSAGKAVSPAEISGLYMWPSKETNAQYSENSSESRQNNFLKITPVQGKIVRLQIATAERNGHNCTVDVRALLCGSRIVFQPNEEDMEILRGKSMNPPQMTVTTTHISFVQNIGGGFLSGPPYCGTMGYLRHLIPRSSRQTSIDQSIFK